MTEELHCAQCHRTILGTAHDPQQIKEKLKTFPEWNKYLSTIKHFKHLPDLGTLARRVDASFIEKYLEDPFDLRPHLEESMYVPQLTQKERKQVARYLRELNGKDAAPQVKRAETPLASENIERGRALFIQFSCPTCHLLGNEFFGPQFSEPLYQAIKIIAPLAPNLRFVRERIPRERLIKFILDPKSIDPSSTMPRLGLTEVQANLIADYLHNVSLSYTPERDLRQPKVLILEREVSFEEVDEAIFSRVCVHCHMDPSLSEGQGGPGNTGGFGFKGAGLSLQTYQGIKRGIKRRGRRSSILKGDRPEATLLMRAVLRRHTEAARDDRSALDEQWPQALPKGQEVPGMPLSLPPLSHSELSLLKTWLAQGAKGPASSQ